MERLLIIEDDKGLNQGLCKALKADNRQILSCQDLKTAREQLLCGSVSLILLDINLPDGSGLDFLREIKANTAALPVRFAWVGRDLTDTFILVGYWEFDELMSVHFLNVSREYVQQIEAQAVAEGMEPFHTDMSVMLSSSFDIEHTLTEIGEDFFHPMVSVLSGS